MIDKVETGQNINIETVVLIRDDNTSPLRWSISRVEEIVRGSDD